MKILEARFIEKLEPMPTVLFIICKDGFQIRSGLKVSSQQTDASRKLEN